MLSTTDADNGDVLGNFLSITLQIIEFKILVKVLVKRLVLLMSNLVGEGQTCAIPNRSI